MISSADLCSSRAFQWEFKSHGALKQFRMAGIQLFYYWLRTDGPCSSSTAQITACDFYNFFFFAGTLGQTSVWLRRFAEVPLKIPISLLTGPCLSGSTGSSNSCACTCKEGSWRIPQNPIANDLVAVQHFTLVRKNALCQALFSALQQCRKERGAVAGQDVGFHMEEQESYLGLGGYLHFWSKRTEHETWFVWSDPVYWAIEGWVGVCGVLSLGHFIQRDQIQLCASAALRILFSK